MRRVFAPFSSLAFVCALALAAAAQVNPPVPAPSAGPVNPPGNVVTPAPGGPSAPVAPATESPSVAPSPLETPAPQATPTQPPIVVEPPQLNVEPGKTVTARVNSALGTVSATVADPAVATVVVDQAQRVVYVSGVKVGATTVTVSDSRGVTRDVPVRVAYAAGALADETTVRVTGNPTSADYLREAVAAAVERAATLRPGASVYVPPETVPIHGEPVVRTENASCVGKTSMNVLTGGVQ